PGVALRRAGGRRGPAPEGPHDDLAEGVGRVRASERGLLGGASPSSVPNSGASVSCPVDTVPVMVLISGELLADYSQVELHPGDGGHVFGMGDIGLANGEFGEHAVLIVPRQWGPVAFEIRLSDAEPAVEPAWDAAVEFSMHVGDSPCATGWAGQGDLDIPLSQTDVRVRYVVLDGQLAQDLDSGQDLGSGEGGPGPERCLLQLWPGPWAAPRTVVSTSPWSQYWTFGQEASELLVELADVPDPERLPLVIDGALEAHPDIGARLRAGDQRYRSGVLRYLQELFQVTHLTGAYDDIRHDHDRLHDLIDERSRTHRG
ncbi:MAG: hypothetical protein QG608_3558, partial [Actinomycetota bacterium]|nr:hypothetical protein [Actinomycetota bacterium]